MDLVGIRALQQNASAVVAKVAGGSSVTITVRGRPVARLVPVEINPIDSLIQSGRARPALRNLSELPKPLPSPAPGRSLSDELEQMRNAERY